MRHHVVQLPGDPGPLLRGGQRGLPVAFGLGLLGPGLDRLQVGAAGAAEDAEDARHRELQRHDEEVVRLVVARQRSAT